VELSLRTAVAADADALTALVHAAYRHYVPRLDGNPGPMEEDYRQVIVEDSVTVAETGGGLVGLLVTRPTPGDFWVRNVAVHPAHQGRGIGRALLAHAERLAVDRGYLGVRLFTHELMTENRALYARLGYVEEGRRDVEGAPLVFLHKDLPAG
jgi:ribosomal protein S18 acetylase RimI-like enzyme